MNYKTGFGNLNALLGGLLTSAMLVATPLAVTGAYAENTPVSFVENSGAGKRIDLSGKLRMLSQRVVAAGCYVQAGIDTDATSAMLTSAAEEFRTITAALEFGDADLGIYGEEADPKIRATLKRLRAIWAPMAVTVDKVLAGTATHEELTDMALQSEPLLEMAKSLVAAVTAEHSMGAALVMRDALAIDIAGRQRMLSQRISKDVCLLATGIDTEHSLADLAQTANLFDTAINALRGGMPSVGLMAPTDEHVIADLKVALADWKIVQSKVSDVLAGNPVDDQRLSEMFALANTLTADMNQVVIDYTKASIDATGGS
jgi:hypothetical protein